MIDLIRKVTTFVIVGSLMYGCSFFGGDNPPAEVAQTYMTRMVGTLTNFKLTNCQGDSNKKSCVASYNRSFGPGRYYEELNMDFQKTPSGWNVVKYRVIKTDTL